MRLAMAPSRDYIASREAVACVRSQYPRGLIDPQGAVPAGSVDPDIWRPPTFVGNSGIERFNGDRGFALLI